VFQPRQRAPAAAGSGNPLVDDSVGVRRAVRRIGGARKAPRIAPPAARWLAPTPIGFAGFATALIWLALLRQLIVMGLLLLLVFSLPLTALSTQEAHRGALWLVLSFALSMLACALAYASSSPDRAGGCALHWRGHRVRAGA